MLYRRNQAFQQKLIFSIAFKTKTARFHAIQTQPGPLFCKYQAQDILNL